MQLIDLDADLIMEDDMGRGLRWPPVGRVLQPGDTVTAGRPGYWSSVVIEEVTPTEVFFRQVRGHDEAPAE